MRRLSVTALLGALLLLQGFSGAGAATCGFVNGRIQCQSALGGGGGGNNGGGGGFPSTPSRPPSSGGPIFNPPGNNPPRNPPSNPPSNGGTVNIGGCVVRAPPRFSGDQQSFARTLFGDLIGECGFLAPNFVRIAFHDSGTFRMGSRNGANGSIRFERGEPANNFGGQIIRTLDIMEEAQRVLRNIGLDLSFADIVQLAAAEAIRAAGGPSYGIRLGRRDATAADDYGSFPATNDNIVSMKQKFSNMGLSVEDLVALSGAHTIGTLAPRTSGIFDNEYYRAILQGQGRLATDNMLVNDQETNFWVNRFANDQNAFFQSFVVAMQKVHDMNAL